MYDLRDFWRPCCRGTRRAPLRLITIGELDAGHLTAAYPLSIALHLPHFDTRNSVGSYAGRCLREDRGISSPFPGRRPTPARFKMVSALGTLARAARAAM